MGFSNIKTKEHFFIASSRITPNEQSKKIYDRVFDTERENENDHLAAWLGTQDWMYRNMFIGFNTIPIEYLLMAYKAVRAKHKYNLSKGLDDSVWHLERMKEFDFWIWMQFEYILKENSVGSDIPDHLNKLSAYELALRQFLINKFTGKKQLTNIEFATKYMNIKSFDNLKKALPKVEHKNKDKEPLGNKNQLKNVKESLNEYPDLQLMITKMINNLN